MNLKEEEMTNAAHHKLNNGDGFWASLNEQQQTVCKEKLVL